MTNLLTTMVIAGAWHGAGWPFIVWGAYHGILLLLYHIAEPLRKYVSSKILSSQLQQNAYAIFSSGLTFFVVAFGWIWFRSANLSSGLQFCGKLARLSTLWKEVYPRCQHGDFTFFATFAMLIILCISGPLVVRISTRLSVELPYWIKVQVASTALILCYIFAGEECKPFIYFQF
jgi:D-alanyl-lipoteichoic acid acyltransferase DltB (MBOAT superfamily)